MLPLDNTERAYVGRILQTGPLPVATGNSMFASGWAPDDESSMAVGRKDAHQKARACRQVGAPRFRKPSVAIGWGCSLQSGLRIGPGGVYNAYMCCRNLAAGIAESTPNSVGGVAYDYYDASADAADLTRVYKLVGMTPLTVKRYEVALGAESERLVGEATTGDRKLVEDTTWSYVMPTTNGGVTDLAYTSGDASKYKVVSLRRSVKTDAWLVIATNDAPNAGVDTILSAMAPGGSAYSHVTAQAYHTEYVEWSPHDDLVVVYGITSTGQPTFRTYKFNSLSLMWGVASTYTHVPTALPSSVSFNSASDDVMASFQFEQRASGGLIGETNAGTLDFGSPFSKLDGAAGLVPFSVGGNPYMYIQTYNQIITLSMTGQSQVVDVMQGYQVERRSVKGMVRAEMFVGGSGLVCPTKESCLSVWRVKDSAVGVARGFIISLRRSGGQSYEWVAQQRLWFEWAEDGSALPTIESLREGTSWEYVNEDEAAGARLGVPFRLLVVGTDRVVVHGAGGYSVVLDAP